MLAALTKHTGPVYQLALAISEAHTERKEEAAASLTDLDSLAANTILHILAAIA